MYCVLSTVSVVSEHVFNDSFLISVISDHAMCN